jgi:hypothetical protein
MDWFFNNSDLKFTENHWVIIKRNVELYGPKNLSKLKIFI